MYLYKLLDLSPSELKSIYASIGGQYTLWERLKRKRIGTPMMFYREGYKEIDALQALASDELRINMELFKQGVVLRIAERTNPYFIPFKKEEILKVKLEKKFDKAIVYFTTSSNTLKLWGPIDHFHGWNVFIENSFLQKKT